MWGIEILHSGSADALRIPNSPEPRNGVVGYTFKLLMDAAFAMSFVHYGLRVRHPIVNDAGIVTAHLLSLPYLAFRDNVEGCVPPPSCIRPSERISVNTHVLHI